MMLTRRGWLVLTVLPGAHTHCQHTAHVQAMHKRSATASLRGKVQLVE